MDNNLHLTVIQENVKPDHDPTQVARLFNPNRTDFVWNADFTAFRPVPLTWWSDASYVAYQTRDILDEE